MEINCDLSELIQLYHHPIVAHSNFFSVGQSYAARVAAAVVQYNTKGHVGSEFRKHIFGTVPSSRLVNMEDGRNRKVVKNAIAVKEKPRVRKVVQDNSGAYYHGDGTEDVDMGPVVFENAKKVLLDK